MFKFWARISLAIILGGVGITLASFLPLPDVTTAAKVKVIYALIGFLTGYFIFSSIVRWVVSTTTRLFKQLILRIAAEIINQFTHLATSGLPFLGESQKLSSINHQVHRPVILDTSAIIDGRFLDVAKVGFLSGVLLIPNFVLTELQQVADSADDLKRTRGRRGFEAIDELKKIPGVKVEIWDRLVKGSTVDDQLIRLGKVLKGRILTCDFNLNRVATISGVEILNINTLANALKTVAIPGERLQVKITHKGKDQTQGVGYLTDGTMIVVEAASQEIGETINIEVVKILQTPTGRMIFGKLSTEGNFSGLVKYHD